MPVDPNNLLDYIGDKMKAARARLNAMPWRKVAAPEFLPGEDIGCDDAALLDLEAREARAQGVARATTMARVFRVVFERDGLCLVAGN